MESISKNVTIIHDKITSIFGTISGIENIINRIDNRSIKEVTQSNNPSGEKDKPCIIEDIEFVSKRLEALQEKMNIITTNLDNML